MTYYRQPIDIGTYKCPITNLLIEYPIWEDEERAEANEIVQGAKDNNVTPQYYMMEFM
jgi:hypothetical protein